MRPDQQEPTAVFVPGASGAGPMALTPEVEVPLLVKGQLRGFNLRYARELTGNWERRCRWAKVVQGG